MFRVLLLTITLVGISNAFSTIKEIRTEYKNIQTSITQKLYKVKNKKIVDEPLEISKTIYINAQGAVKKLLLKGGSGDSFHTKEYFYSNDGKLFFTYQTSSDVHNGSSEIRRYYNSEMRLIKEIVTPLKKGEHSISSPFPLLPKTIDALEYFKDDKIK